MPEVTSHSVNEGHQLVPILLYQCLLVSQSCPLKRPLKPCDGPSPLDNASTLASNNSSPEILEFILENIFPPSNVAEIATTHNVLFKILFFIFLKINYYYLTVQFLKSSFV